MANVPLLAVRLGPHELAEILLAPFTVLGTGATFWAGLLAAIALVRQQPAEEIAAAANRGLAVGFIVSAPAALPALVAALPSGNG